MSDTAPSDEAAPADAVLDSAPAEPIAEQNEIPAVSDGAGNTGQPRRRRRRGRRGRGRGGAGTGIVNAADASVTVSTPTIPAAVEEEPFVPRGVVAHELMPAATGGRRRRGHRGGRARPGVGGEPIDPQLISPSNPVPKPRFDED